MKVVKGNDSSFGGLGLVGFLMVAGFVAVLAAMNQGNRGRATSAAPVVDRGVGFYNDPITGNLHAYDRNIK